METGGRESQRGVHDQSDADLAPTRYVEQPVTTAVAECNRPLDKLHNSVGNRIVEESPICGPAQAPEIIRDVRQHCEAHQRRPTPRVMGVGSFVLISNARVAGRPFVKSATVKAPLSSAHDRAAAWN